MPDDPTGAARTALREAIMAARCEQYHAGSWECDGPDGCGDCLDAIAEAVMAHLAQAGADEVRALVDRLEAEIRAFYGDTGDEEIAPGWPKARTALLAAFAALRQQRDEAVARANEAENELAKAHDFGEAQRDKAATERQRAERLYDALREISCRQWEVEQAGDTDATISYSAVVRVVNIARAALSKEEAR